MSDVAVSPTLDDTNAHLKAIHDEVAYARCPIGPRSSRRPSHGPWRAMTEFVQSWWAHRDKIDKRLDDLSKKVDDCCSTWSDADKKLKESLEHGHA